jgi:NAD(P)-dependent dehydrogenase (short-subunit alcohol dehydrogenase family)
MLRRRRQIGGSVAVVTGASSGVGRAAARALAERGASVVVAARSEPDLEEAARECRAAGAQALAVPTDVGDEAAVRALARRALDEFGRIDVWVNDAGVIAYGHFEDIPSDAYERVIRTNLLGEIYGARAALEAFHEQRSGVLVNLSSLWGRVTSPYVSPYVVSKFGVRAFSECLRQGLRDQPDTKDIHVCTILPESIDTPIFRHAANYSGRSVQAVPPIADPQRVVRAILRCVERPKPEITVGMAGHLLEWGHALTPPRLYNRIVPRVFDWTVFGSNGVEPTAGNLFAPMAELNRVDGGWRRTPGARWRRRVAVGSVVAAPLIATALATRGNDGAMTLTRKGGKR